MRRFLLSEDPVLTPRWEALGWGPAQHSRRREQARL